MTYKGHVENGVIVLDDGVTLPEGATVEIIPPRLPPGEHHPDVVKFAGALASELNPSRHPFAGVIPADMDLKKAYYEHLWEKHS